MPTILSLICEFCNKKFARELKTVNGRQKAQCKFIFCSNDCKNKHYTKARSVTCTNCNKNVTKQLSDIKKSKSGNHFCSKSCAATYNNKHKKYGTRRSKLEKWLEQELVKLYPDYNILFNDKSTIKSELDIYFPDIKLAIEINGIFHYKPIYGEDSLKKIQNNDKRKALLCEENNIVLHSIDVSKQKRFTEENSKKYLEIIREILF